MEGKKFTILHFNDVYEIGEKSIHLCGGVARFHTLVKSFQQEEPALLFSGDLWSPSKCITFSLPLSKKNQSIFSIFRPTNCQTNQQNGY